MTLNSLALICKTMLLFVLSGATLFRLKTFGSISIAARIGAEVLLQYPLLMKSSREVSI